VEQFCLVPSNIITPCEASQSSSSELMDASTSLLPDSSAAEESSAASNVVVLSLSMPIAIDCGYCSHIIHCLYSNCYHKETERQTRRRY